MVMRAASVSGPWNLSGAVTATRITDFITNSLSCTSSTDLHNGPDFGGIMLPAFNRYTGP
jgi:hypothetical protein